MKELNYKNGSEIRTFQYQTRDELFSGIETDFYEGVEEYEERQFLFFGKKIKKTKPKFLFTILADIENPDLTELWWTKEISKKIKN